MYRIGTEAAPVNLTGEVDPAIDSAAFLGLEHDICTDDKGQLREGSLSSN